MKNKIERRLLLLTINRFGHVNPGLFHAEKFKAAGWQVYLPSSKEFRKVVENRGIEFIELTDEDGFDYKRPKNFTLVGGASEVLRISRNILPILKDLVSELEPDLILTDTVALWGKMLAKETGVPFISYSALLGLDAKVFERYQLLTDALGLGEIQDIYGITKVVRYSTELRESVKKLSYFDLVKTLFNNYSSMNILHTSRYFQPMEERFGSKFKFIGPAVNPEDYSKEASWEIKEDSVLISLGSSFTDNPKFYRDILKCYEDRDTQVILSIPEGLERQLHVEQYRNVITGNHLPGKKYLNQKAVLSKVKYFITHSGFNSTMESAYASVPTICVPQMIEQEINARRMEELGMGIVLPKTPRVTDLHIAIGEIESNYKKYKKGVEKVKRSFVTCDSYSEILEFANRVLARRST